MAIIAQYIFGSHARGDFNKDSDIDLLAVTDEDVFSTFSHGELNVSFYPKTRLLEDARDGSLFVMHIVREAVATYDPANLHNSVLKSFVQRANYNSEIEKASDLAWFLFYRHAQFKNRKIVTRRISWCVRTILISHTVNKGFPIFSPHELVAFSNKSYVDSLLHLKSGDELKFYDLDHLVSFLLEFGYSAPRVILEEDLRGVWELFKERKNSIGIKTIAQMDIDIDQEFYT